MTEDWRAIHELILRWAEDGDSDAGARILRYLAEGVIDWNIGTDGVVLRKGPRWAQWAEEERHA